MRNIIILIAGLLLVLSSTIAQIVKDEPQQKRFLFNDKDNSDSTSLNADDPYFQSDEFIIGWHWAGTSKISTVLRANQQDIRSGLYETSEKAGINVNPGFLLTTQPPHQTHCVDPQIADSRAIQFEPTVLIDSNNPFELQTNSDGTQVPFGFRSIDNRASINSYQDQGYNSMRLYIDKDSLAMANPSNPIRILSEPWPSDEWYMFLSRYFPEREKLKDSVNRKYLNDFMCKTLYVSIKLRITDSLEIPGDEILKVEVPCFYAYRQGGIIYDSLLFKPYIKIEPKEEYEPDLSPLDLSLSLPADSNAIKFYSNVIIKNTADLEINPSRTPYQKTRFIDSIDQKQYLIIKRDMLPPDLGDDIVITFAIVFEEDNNRVLIFPEERPIKLKFIKSYDVGALNLEYLIHDIGLDISYLGKYSVEIDWIRFETPNAQNLARGAYDDYIAEDIQKLLSDFDKNVKTDTVHNETKIHRIVPICEGRLIHWYFLRYYNQLIGNISSFEFDDVPYPEHFIHYTKCPERWNGVIGFPKQVSAPFYRNAFYHQPEDSLGYLRNFGSVNGYTGWYSDSVESDPNVTHYEDYNRCAITNPRAIDIYYFLEPDNDEKFDEYSVALNPDNNNGRASFLSAFEFPLYNSFFKEDRNKGLFQESPLWWQTFILNRWTAYPYNDKLYKYNDNKFFTGEEIKLVSSLPVLLGAKGLIYDGPDSSILDTVFTRIYDNTWIDSNDRVTLENMDDELFLQNELAGSDFIRLNDEICYINDRTYVTNDSISILSTNLARPEDKIYIGRKSQRIALKIVHDWVRAIEDTLMNLRLQAWFAKGYRYWYLQHPDIVTDSLLSDIVSPYGVRTRRPFFDPADGYEGNKSFTDKYYYLQDSSFFDLTILKDNSSQSDLKDYFYLGVQNRRTNPLIHESYYGKTLLQFYSTAEMYDFCQNGGERIIENYPGSYTSESMDTTYWQDKFWKRYGCREITVPYNFGDDDDINRGEYYLVKELGGDVDSLNEKFWRGEKYYDNVGTLVSKRNPLIAKFLPGEGKLLVHHRNQLINDTGLGDDYYCDDCGTVFDSVEIVQHPEQHNQDSTETCVRFELINHSDCNFDLDNLLIEYTGSNSSALIISSADGLTKDSSMIADGKEYFVMDDAILPENDSKSLTICYPYGEEFILDFLIGTFQYNTFFACDSNLTDRHYSSDCCDDIEIMLDSLFECGDGCKCGYAFRLNYIGIDPNCTQNLSIVWKLGRNGNVESNDSITYVDDELVDLCAKPGKNYLHVQIFRDDTLLVCEKFEEFDCNYCDDIEIEIIPLPFDAINCERDYFNFLIDYADLPCSSDIVVYKEIFRNNAKIIESYVDSASIILEHSYSFNKFIPDTPMVIEYEHYFHFINSNGDTICSKLVTTEVRAGDWGHNPIESYIGDSDLGGLCCRPITVVQEDTSGSIPIWGISIINPNDTIAPIWSEIRDPATDFAFDLSSDYLLTNYCVPTDSLFKYRIGFYDIDSVLVYCIDVEEQGCVQQRMMAPQIIADLSARPNPVSYEVTFDYELLQAADINLMIFNQFGQPVAQVAQGKRKAGKYSETYYTKKLINGIYYGVLAADGEFKSVQIRVLR